MGIYRHQFSGIMALPVKIQKTEFHSGMLTLNDAYFLIIDNFKSPLFSQYDTKALAKKLRKTEQDLCTIMTPDVIYGVMINGTTGVARQIPHATVPEPVIYTQSEFEMLESAMQQQIGTVAEMISLLLGQTIKFETERKSNFEYWC